jgi:hypothetical protein
MIKKCALPGCGVEFETNRHNKIFCCYAHYYTAMNKANCERQRLNRVAGKDKFKCLKCERRINKRPHEFCTVCRKEIHQRHVEDTLIQEHRCIA